VVGLSPTACVLGPRGRGVAAPARASCPPSPRPHSPPTHHHTKKHSPSPQIFRLAFGPKTFVVVSDPDLARQVLLTDAAKYSKGLLSEILDFVMGQGLIPADGEVWVARRRAIVPALHRKYIASMLGMFGDCALHGAVELEKAAVRAETGQVAESTTTNPPPPPGAVEMENYFSRLTLDIIGKAVFNYDFDSLTNDDPFIQAVYTALREAEYRSTAFLPYWNFAPLRWLVPRQRKCTAALAIINATLDGLVDRCKAMVEAEDAEFGEEYLAAEDPSILRFLIASGEEISSKQLRDDLMTLLIAGHETTAAVLTWTLYCLVNHPSDLAAVQAEVDAVLGDGTPTLDNVGGLRLTSRAVHEAMRLYPQPPVLIRRALEDTRLGGYDVPAGADMFISVWNLHRDPGSWPNPDVFDMTRFGPLDGPPPSEVTTGFAYLPFGGGRRKCVGDQFALLEAVTGLAVLLRRFDFEVPPGAPDVGMTTGATIHTSAGLWLKPVKRVVGKEGVPAAAGVGVKVREEEVATAAA
jgi:beta-ring hydroxylase